MLRNRIKGTPCESWRHLLTLDEPSSWPLRLELSSRRLSCFGFRRLGFRG